MRVSERYQIMFFKIWQNRFCVAVVDCVLLVRSNYLSPILNCELYRLNSQLLPFINLKVRNKMTDNLIIGIATSPMYHMNLVIFDNTPVGANIWVQVIFDRIAQETFVYYFSITKSSINRIKYSLPRDMCEQLFYLSLKYFFYNWKKLGVRAINWKSFWRKRLALIFF